MDFEKMDKNAFSIGDLHDEEELKRYWLSKTPQERLQAMELMRKILYGNDAVTSRLQRFFEIAELK